MTEVYTPPFTKLHYDELKDYAIRGLNHIEPGMEVLRIHRPTLEDTVDFYDSFMKIAISPSVQQSTVKEVRRAKYSELANFETQRFEESFVAIIFESKDTDDPRFIDFTYASDAGVVPYDHANFWNKANFLVDLDELYKAGIEPILDSVSEKYAKENNIDLYGRI